MSVLFRGAPEVRDFGSVPRIPRNSEQGGGMSVRRVDLTRADSAMQKVAIASSINLLASIVETVPLHAYTGRGKAKRQIELPPWFADLGGDGHGLEDWMAQVMWSWGLRGNLVGLNGDRDPKTGKPRFVTLKHPDDLRGHRDPSSGRIVWTMGGKVVETDKVFHRRVYPVPGYVMGASPIAQHALTIGSGIAAEQFGAQFFLDGGHPTAVFQNTKAKVDEGQARKIKRRIRAVMAGNREPLVLGADWTWKNLQVAPNESQFLETNKYSEAQCARIYGPGMAEILGYESGGSMTYQNVEQRSIDLLKFTVNPWLRRFERMLSWFLPNPQWVYFERKALLETDVLTRFKVHEIALRNDIEVVNEVRDLEDLPPVPWGDEPTTNKSPAPTPVVLEE